MRRRVGGGSRRVGREIWTVSGPFPYIGSGSRISQRGMPLEGLLFREGFDHGPVTELKC